MKVSYEVTVTVDKKIEAEYVAWMTEHHIPQICELSGVEDALFFKIDTPEEGTNDYKTFYLFENQEHLETYLNKHATAIRKEFSDKFGDSSITKRHVNVLLKWYSQAK